MTPVPALALKEAERVFIAAKAIAAQARGNEVRAPITAAGASWNYVINGQGRQALAETNPAIAAPVVLALAERLTLMAFEKAHAAALAGCSAGVGRGDHGSISSSITICSSLRSAMLSWRQPVRRKMWIARRRAGVRPPFMTWLAYGTLIPVAVASAVGEVGASMSTSLHIAN
jgi:hypothetical protein